MEYTVRLANRTDQEIRDEARKNYNRHPRYILESVVRMNAGTQVAEKGITREVALELLEERYS